MTNRPAQQTAPGAIIIIVLSGIAGGVVGWVTTSWWSEATAVWIGAIVGVVIGIVAASAMWRNSPPADAPRARQDTDSDPRRSWGERGVGEGAIVVLSLTLVALTIVLVGLLLIVWPRQLVPTEQIPEGYDQQLILTVALAGALGASIHVLNSFRNYVGARKLRWSWVPTYFMLPAIGALLGTIIYMVLRAGLVPSTQGTNVFGFVAIGALAGLFSEQTIKWLREIYSTLSTQADKSADPLRSGQPTLTSTDPVEGPAGSSVLLHGEHLDTVTEVRFGDALRSPVSFEAVSRTYTTLVPADASPGSYPLTLVAGDAEHTSNVEFTVIAGASDEAEEGSGDGPPSEDPPDSGPPSEDPPSEDPPSGDPPSEDPPGDDSDAGGGGAPVSPSGSTRGT